tara:strand:+ start:1625 stop:2116 length:492 start_codon:yes stop_codon:yes gene_type:complete
MNNYQISFFTVFFLTIQLLLVDLLSLNLIRPDFLVIFILYLSMIKGKMYGMTVGFTIGFLSNLFGVGSYFGLEALSLTIVGYLGGYLKNIYEKVLPYIFHILWILIILLHFLVICYFRYQNIYISNLFEFLFIWITTTSYTMLFIISIQFIFPFRDASNAEIS